MEENPAPVSSVWQNPSRMMSGFELGDDVQCERRLRGGVEAVSSVSLSLSLSLSLSSLRSRFCFAARQEAGSESSQPACKPFLPCACRPKKGHCSSRQAIFSRLPG